MRNAGKNVWPRFPRRPNGALAEMYRVLEGKPPCSYTSPMLDKSDAVGIPVSIISLDMSKAFDRVHFPAL